jgi:hypothetical protein
MMRLVKYKVDPGIIAEETLKLCLSCQISNQYASKNRETKPKALILLIEK